MRAFDQLWAKLRYICGDDDLTLIWLSVLWHPGKHIYSTQEHSSHKMLNNKHTHTHIWRTQLRYYTNAMASGHIITFFNAPIESRTHTNIVERYYRWTRNDTSQNSIITTCHFSKNTTILLNYDVFCVRLACVGLYYVYICV